MRPVLQRLNAPSGEDAAKPIVVGITGLAGIGKSRLLDEFLTRTSKRGHRLQGAASRLNQPPYSGFTSMIKEYLGITLSDSLRIVQAKFEEGLHRLAVDVQDEMKLPFLQDSAPVLGFLLGLPAEDVRVQLTGQELQPHLQTAIRYFLEVLAAKANRAGSPLLVILKTRSGLMKRRARRWVDSFRRRAAAPGARKRHNETH